MARGRQGAPNYTSTHVSVFPQLLLGLNGLGSRGPEAQVMARGPPVGEGVAEGKCLASQPTLLFCMSLLAPFFSSTTAASTLFTARPSAGRTARGGSRGRDRVSKQVRSRQAGRSGVGRRVRWAGGSGWAGGHGVPLSGPSRLTQAVHGADVGVGVDEVLQHALHGVRARQDQRGRGWPCTSAKAQAGGSVRIRSGPQESRAQQVSVRPRRFLTRAF